ncbi:diaminopimelate decarboxylase [Halodesulfurarchaeum sp. HSR-GB]|uniref:diaminopimelate decarboxylase n=1 Tax=Halodesulfurarchaeum sp. HSR-GB TaxID=3074077 RepID=UPI002863C01A|nr:diaminopimelate decarboxylase [Halodesulfurarchaeum sp. HSR-GB]MDR5656895.1 diaminopimelate decarboxylase [Halodesulfurarchaeum sp. HSR-GB]
MTGPTVRRLDDWERDPLQEIAETHGTPAYVIDLDRIRENLDRLQTAFPDARLLYAVKANAGRAVLQTLADAGVGAECASAGEVRRALEAGFDPANVQYTPVNAPARDLDAVLVGGGAPITITVDAMDTIDRLAERGFDGGVAIRIHPGTGAGHSDAVATGADAKFGIPVDRVPEAVAAGTEQGLDVVGLHAHAGSGILDDGLAAHRAVVETIASVATDLDTDLEFVDVGGGFGVPYRPDEEPLDLDAIATATREALAGVDAELRIEPGRYLVADAGVLLTRVNTVKPAGDGVLAGVDAGMTDLLRPALYDAYHPVKSLTGDQAGETETVSVVGPICESTDVLARDRRLPKPERGELYGVGFTGAYGIEMASQYNSRPRAPVIAMEDGSTKLVRRRETVEDVINSEVDR